MIKRFISLVCILIFISILQAQTLTVGESQRDKNYTFVYICRDYQISPKDVCRLLDSYYKLAQQYGHTCIFYLADENNKPIILKLNTGHGDNPNDFALLKEEIQTNVHNAIFNTDVDNILRLINETDFVDNNHVPLYKNIRMEFCVSQMFLQYRSQEQIIVPLYCALKKDIPVIMFSPSVSKSDYKKIDVPAEQGLFGIKNVNKINEEVILVNF